MRTLSCILSTGCEMRLSVRRMPRPSRSSSRGTTAAGTEDRFMSAYRAQEHTEAVSAQLAWLGRGSGRNTAGGKAALTMTCAGSRYRIGVPDRADVD